MEKIVGKSSYRPDIQGLRAIAVLFVVIYHSGMGYFPGGYIGVDVFFVISGYLITGLLLRELERTGSVDMLQFYARRIRRLIPAATVMLLTMLGVTWLLYSPLEMKQFGSSAFATAIYLSNFWFANLSTDYLAEDTDANPLLHTWSLSVEEQFYLIWPLFLLILVRSAVLKDVRKRLLMGMGALSIVSFIASILLTKYNQPWAFFNSPTRAWEFGFGGLVALIPLEHFKLRASISGLLGMLGFVLILLAASFFDNRVSFPGYAAVLPVFGAALLIGACHGSPIVGVNKWISARPMQFIGDISYSLYLWHWPVFVFMDFLYVDIGVVGQLSGILLSFFLAWVTVVLIENPFRFSKSLTQHVWASIVVGLVLSFSSAGIALVTREMSAIGMESPSQKRYFTAKNDIPLINEEGCHAKFLQVDTPDCIYGDLSADKTIVLFGDSHAAQWFPALEKLSQQHNWRLISITKTGCPSMSFEPFNFKLNRPYTECTQWREKAFKRIREFKPQITILANSSKYFSGSDENAVYQNLENWRQGVKQTFTRLMGSSASIVVMRDTPWLNYSVPICLSRANWQKKDSAEMCNFNTNNSEPNEIFKLEQQELATLDKGLMIDMNDIICSEQQCSVERDGIVLFHDAHHLSASFSRTLADALYEKIKFAMPR